MKTENCRVPEGRPENCKETPELPERCTIPEIPEICRIPRGRDENCKEGEVEDCEEEKTDCLIPRGRPARDCNSPNGSPSCSPDPECESPRGRPLSRGRSCKSGGSSNGGSCKSGNSPGSCKSVNSCKTPNSCKSPKSCKSVKSCKSPNSCKSPKSCKSLKSCKSPKSCKSAKSCKSGKSAGSCKSPKKSCSPGSSGRGKSPCSVLSDSPLGSCESDDEHPECPHPPPTPGENCRNPCKPWECIDEEWLCDDDDENEECEKDFRTCTHKVSYAVPRGNCHKCNDGQHCDIEGWPSSKDGFAYWPNCAADSAGVTVENVNYCHQSKGETITTTMKYPSIDKFRQDTNTGPGQFSRARCNAIEAEEHGAQEASVDAQPVTKGLIRATIVTKKAAALQ